MPTVYLPPAGRMTQAERMTLLETDWTEEVVQDNKRIKTTANKGQVNKRDPFRPLFDFALHLLSLEVAQAAQAYEEDRVRIIKSRQAVKRGVMKTAAAP